MNPNEVRFSQTMLSGSNKTGLLKADESGYYTVVLGAFNVHNCRGDFYPLTDIVKEHFQPNSRFQELMHKQALRGEYEHPMIQPGESKENYLRRLEFINPDRVTHHIREVWLDANSYKDEEGRQIVGVLGKVKPSGMLGHILEKTITNPHENVAFSVRSFSRNIPLLGGTLRREISRIITWDYVLTGGIYLADKFYSPALENDLEDIVFDQNIVFKALEGAKREAVVSNYSNESKSVVMGLESLCRSVGWEPKANTKFLNW